MVKAPTEADLTRLRMFLKRLESDAQVTLGEIDEQEIEKLKDEIAYLEDVLNGRGDDYGSKAFLFRIAINYGAPRAARQMA